MKKNYLFTLLLTLCFSAVSFGQSVVITAILDGKAPSDGCSGSSGSSNPKALELYVSGTVDFNGYKYEAEANGPSSSGESWSSEDISSLGIRTDEFVYIAASGATVLYELYSGATAANTYVGGSSFNGNDALRITDGTNVLDQFGNPSDVTGSSDHDNSWEYEDSFATRKSGSTANSGAFDVSNWVVPGRNYLDDKTSCGEMLSEVNFGSYSTVASTTPEITVTGSTSSFDYFEGFGPSAEQSVTFSGENLTADISITAPANFEVSLISLQNLHLGILHFRAPVALSSSNLALVKMRFRFGPCLLLLMNVTPSKTSSMRGLSFKPVIFTYICPYIFGALGLNVLTNGIIVSSGICLGVLRTETLIPIAICIPLSITPSG